MQGKNLHEQCNNNNTAHDSDKYYNSVPALGSQRRGGIDGCLLAEPPALALVFIYQTRLNAIYTAKLS